MTIQRKEYDDNTCSRNSCSLSFLSDGDWCMSWLHEETVVCFCFSQTFTWVKAMSSLTINNLLKHVMTQTLMNWAELLKSKLIRITTNLNDVRLWRHCNCHPVSGSLLRCWMVILREAIVSRLWSSPLIGSTVILIDICFVMYDVRVDYLWNPRSTGPLE